MSGTSADGIDAALVEIQEETHHPRVQLLAFQKTPYPHGLRERILSLSADPDALREVCHLNFLLGELFSQAALQLVKGAGYSLPDVHLIGSHGQTICHLPIPIPEHEFYLRSTLQIGESSIIAERTGLTTVADFRPRDIAAGGEGAPLTPYPHYLLFRHTELSRVVVNLGGISNLTFLQPKASPEEVIAFDAGPGNVLIDGVVRRLSAGAKSFDTDGAWAASGQVDDGLLEQLLNHPFFRRSPPRSAGQEEFGVSLIEEIMAEASRRKISPADLVTTVSTLTVEAIARSLEAYIFPRGVPHQILLAGGGAQNRWLKSTLAARLPASRVLTTDEIEFPSEGVEAVSFALLAYLTVKGRPGNLPEATGARWGVPLGKIVPGRDLIGLLTPVSGLQSGV